MVNGCELGDVSRGVESWMRGKEPGEMENLKFVFSKVPFTPSFTNLPVCPPVK